MVTTESPKSTAISFRRTIIGGTIQAKSYKRNLPAGTKYIPAVKSS
jgi:hypothetical protein